MIKQRHDKDCLQACLAHIFSIPYDTIPEFYKLYPDGIENYKEENALVTNAYDSWLLKKGFFRIITVATHKNESIVFPYSSIKPFGILGSLCKEGCDLNHCVVLNLHNGRVTMEDPLKGSDFDLNDLYQLELIFKHLKED